MTADEIHKIAALETCHWWYRGTREICMALLRPHIAGRQPLHILDIGCGTGGNLAVLSEFGHARGIDPDPLCVDYGRRKGLECSHGNMLDFVAPPASLDLVTLFDVLTQVDRDAFPAILARIAESLVPNGVLAFREPAMPIARGAHDRAVNIHHRFNASEVGALLNNAGFEPLRVTYLNTLLFPPIVLARRLQDTLFPTLAASDVRPTPAPLNALLLGVLRLEKQFLRISDLPFGVSLMAVARKPGRD